MDEKVSFFDKILSLIKVKQPEFDVNYVGRLLNDNAIREYQVIVLTLQFIHQVARVISLWLILERLSLLAG